MAAITAASDASYELLVTPEELKGGLKVDYNYEAYARKTLAGDADDIERAWTKKLETHPKTYDGFKFRLHDIVKGDKVTLQVGLTGYREFVGTQTNPRLRAAGNAYLSNALGCECVLTTADKKFVLMKRSTDVAFASGLYNGPSGHAEPQYVWNKNIAREVLRDGIVREIVEEVGIPEKALSEPRLIGVMRDSDLKPDCLFVVETTQTADEVREGYRHALEAWESERLAFVDSEDCGLALTPVTRAAFACLARDRAL